MRDLYIELFNSKDWCKNEFLGHAVGNGIDSDGTAGAVIDRDLHLGFVQKLCHIGHRVVGLHFLEEDVPSDSGRSNAGIGLSVCATIIKAHGGDITAENAKEGGAIFRFSLTTEEVSNESKQI